MCDSTTGQCSGNPATGKCFDDLDACRRGVCSTYGAENPACCIGADGEGGATTNLKVNGRCCTLRPRTTPATEENSMLQQG